MQGVERFAQFEILKTLESGRLATVYLAIDHAHDREVALKIFDPTSVPQSAREAAEQRFTDETRAAMALRHPKIVSVFDVGHNGEVPYVIMESVYNGP